MKIVFLEPLGVCKGVLNVYTSGIVKQGHQVKIFDTKPATEEEMISRAEDAEVLVISNIPIHKSFLDHCPRLQLISVAFTGLDHINMEACRERGIVVKNTAGYATRAVAELTLGMMIAVYRKIVGGDAITRMQGARENFLGTELFGKTVGVVGMGAIGKRVASLLQAFGCKIIAHTRTPEQIDGVEFTDKETLLRCADVVTLHIPLTPETTDFIGRHEFSLMKPEAILINTARGAIVNRSALCEALRNSQIAGAAVDVYEQEPPLPENYELFDAPNLLMLPHMGYATKEAIGERVKMVISDLENWFLNRQNL